MSTNWKLRHVQGNAALHTWQCVNPDCRAKYHSAIFVSVNEELDVTIPIGDDQTQGEACKRFNRVSELMDHAIVFAGKVVVQ